LSDDIGLLKDGVTVRAPRAARNIQVIRESGGSTCFVFDYCFEAGLPELLTLSRRESNAAFSRERLTWNSDCSRQRASVSKSSIIATAQRKSWLQRSVYDNMPNNPSGSNICGQSV
jgi:hypothetical protein